MTPSSHRNDRRGFVLIAVLLVVVLLAVVLLEFNYETRMSVHLSDNCYRSQQALYAAEAGLNLAMAAIGQGDGIRSRAGVERFLSGAVQIRVGDDACCTVSVEAENGKINVHALKSPEGQLDRRRIDQLLRLIDLLNGQYAGRAPIGYGIVPAIIDWTDANDDVTHLPFVQAENEGAENAYYEQLPPPRRCKNAPLDSIRELLLVRGVTPEIFDGTPGDDAQPRIEGMGRFLTIYGDGKIDINAAPALVIRSLWEKIDAAAAQAVIDSRPFASLDELARVAGIAAEALPALGELVTVKPDDPCYRISARGAVGDFGREIVAVVRKNRQTGAVAVLLREEP